MERSSTTGGVKIRHKGLTRDRNALWISTAIIAWKVGKKARYM